MGALSVLTGIGNIGEQFGEAKDAVRKESEARSNKLREFASSDAYLQLAKQQESRQQAEFEQRKKAGDLIEMKDGRIWSVSQGKFINQDRPDPKLAMQKFIQQADPRIRKILEPKVSAVAAQYPYDDEKMINALRSEYDSAQKEVQRQDDVALAESNRQEAAQTRETERREDQRQREQDKRRDDEIRRQEHLTDRKLMMDYSKSLLGMKPSADEVRRADLAENVNENLDAIEEIVKRRPELFGPIHGLITTLHGKVGTSDEDIAALEQARDNLGRALQGAHGMRSATGVVAAGNSVLNGFRNSDKAILSAINRARSSVGTFTADVQRKAGAAGAAPAAGAPDPNDPLGVLNAR